MRFINDEIETFERAKDRINPTVIGDIVTEVMHWRGIDRRNPDRIDAEPDKIIEPLPDTIKIAYAITVRVLKGPLAIVDGARPRESPCRTVVRHPGSALHGA